MKRIIITSIIVIILIAGTWAVRHNATVQNPAIEPVTKESVTAEGLNRIISMSPSFTETLFALGLSDRVVGVTSFCTYPPEAHALPKVGGYVDPNYEAVAILEPDMIFLLPEQESAQAYLKEFNIPFIVTDNKTTTQILETIVTIGAACGLEDSAGAYADGIRERMERIRLRTQGLKRPKVMISIGRSLGAKSVKDIYIAGKGTYFDELIESAGGINAYDGPDIDFPVMSAEGLLHIDPDIIIDLVPGLATKGLDESDIRREWDSVPNVSAVKNNRVYVISDRYTVIPGPRFILFLEDLVEIIHPEAGLENE